MKYRIKSGIKAVSLEQYSKRGLDKRFLKIISDIALSKYEKLLRCRKQVRVGTCEGGSHRFLKGSLCRLRDLDPLDARAFSRDQATDAYDTLQLRAKRLDGHRDRVWFGVLTMPKELWKKVPDDGLKSLRALAAEWVNSMFSEGGRYVLYFRADSQFWHSDKPLEGWYPHVHLTVSSIAWDTREKKHVRLNLFQMDMRKVNDSRMSKQWRTLLERSYGSIRSKHVNVWWHYGEGRARVEHWLSYSNRNPVIDVYNKLGNYIYMGSDDQIAWLTRLLLRPKGEKRGQWFGCASDGVKSRYLKKLEIVLPKIGERRKARSRKLCPKCGEEIIWDRHLMSLVEAASLYPGIEVLCFGKLEIVALAWRAT